VGRVCFDVCVIGAGIVGVTTALELRSRGYDVVLIDRRGPGLETSSGNAGVLSRSTVQNVNNPSILRELPRLMMGQSPYVRYDPRYALTQPGWLFHFFRFAAPRYSLPAAILLKDLQTRSMKKHRMLIDQSNARRLFRDNGWLKVYRTTRGFNATSRERNLMNRLDITYSVLNEDDLIAHEPALRGTYTAGLLLNETCSVVDPGALTRLYFELFLRDRGQYLSAEVSEFHAADRQWEVAFSDREPIVARQTVIAAGPWSPDVCAMLGYRIPMAWERGYHQHVISPVNRLRRPILDVERGFVMAPQGDRTRITSGVEFAHRDAAPDYDQINCAVAEAQAAAGCGEVIDRVPWLGSRPTLPDGFPMIGPAPRHEGVWFNFGHQHIGMSISAGCAEILADLFEGKVSADVDYKAYRPGRFRL